MFKLSEIIRIFPKSVQTENIHSSERIKEKSLFFLRLINLIINIIICTCDMIVVGGGKFWRYFTQWGLVLTILTLILLIFSYLSSTLSSPNQVIEHPKRRVRKLNYLGLVLYEMCWATECLITLVFWAVLMPLFAHHLLNPQQKYIGLVYIGILGAHITPIIWLILEAVFNQIRFIPGHIWFPFGFTFIYMIVDIIITFADGESAYPILTYRDWLTPIVIIAFLLLLIGFWTLGFYIHEKKYRNYISKYQSMSEQYIEL